MSRTRGALPAPSPRCTTRQRASSAQVPSDSPSQATKAPQIPLSDGGAAIGATTSRLESSVQRPPAKMARTSSPSESSRAPEPPADSEVPTDLSPGSIIRRLMLIASPIEGNSDYRARPFHSELYFDQKAMRQQPEPRDSYDLLQSPIAIHFTIEGRHGVLEARHIAKLYIFCSSQRIHLFSASKRFTLDKWNQLAGYSVPPRVPPMVAPPVPPQPEQDELPVEAAPPVPTPEATSAASPTTPTVPPVAPITSEPSITISPDLPASSAPIAPAEDTIPAKVRIPPPQDEPPTVTATPEDASSPLEAPTT
ncbi:hypothetical protein AAG906_010206 [Vitis piasezkii]